MTNTKKNTRSMSAASGAVKGAVISAVASVAVALIATFGPALVSQTPEPPPVPVVVPCGVWHAHGVPGVLAPGRG